MVPNGWISTKLGNVLTVGGGKDYKHLDKGDIPVYGSGGYMLSVSEYLYDGESVCIGRKGTINKPMFLKGKFWTVDTLFYTHSFNNSVPYYIYQFFQTVNWRSLNEASGVPSLSKTIVNNVKINLPPLPEQRKIAQILSTWDRGIATTEKLIDASKQQKKALMQQLLTGKKRLIDPETGKAFEGDWEEVKLETAAGKIFGGGTPSRSVPDYWNGCIPWVTVKDLVSSKIHGAKEHISELGLSNSSANIVPKGHVIIATRMAVGKAVVATCNVAINQDLKAISPSDVLDSVFLHYWFMWKSDLIEGMGTGSTVKGVQISSIKSMGILLPAVPEQRKIASALTAADKDIELLEAKLAHLKQEKKALMQQLLTGKRRVSLSS